MYIYHLSYGERDGDVGLNIGYFTSYKRARKVIKKYRSTLPGFKEESNKFKIKKIKVDFDSYYFS